MKAIFDIEQSVPEEERYGKDFVDICTVLAFDLASYKNPAFSEEKEVRLVHLVNFEKSNE